MNAEAKTNKVAESDTVSTPYTTDSKKRPLSFPLDPCEAKKQITMSEPTTNPEIISQDSQDGRSNTDIYPSCLVLTHAHRIFLLARKKCLLWRVR